MGCADLDQVAAARRLLACWAKDAGRAKTGRPAGQKVFGMRVQTLLTAVAVALSAPLAACATATPTGYIAPNPGMARVDDGLLSEPPADAKAGQCFAKVVVPGQPVYGPPGGPHLKWVQGPPPPGAIGPVWCQVWEQGYAPTVTLTPERYGWIRVICDHDATREKIEHIQHRLHDWGFYQGGYGGQYDSATADAVKHFQDQRHIEHGGYLSFRTMEALESAPPTAPQPMMAPPVVARTYIAPPPAMGQGYAAQGYAAQSYASQSYVAQSYAPPVVQQIQPIYVQAPPVYAQQPPVYAQQPCQAGCAPQVVYQPAPQPCGACQPAGGYGYPYGGVQAYSVQQRWLTWSGKTGY